MAPARTTCGSFGSPRGSANEVTTILMLIGRVGYLPADILTRMMQPRRVASAPMLTKLIVVARILNTRLP